MKWFRKSKRKDNSRYCRTCYRRMKRIHENSDKFFTGLERDFRKGWRDSFRDRNSFFDRTVIGMFMIGAIATAVGLI
jgi:hypothetical protein